MPTEDNVKVINVDVILAGEVDSKPLLRAFGDGVVVLHENGPLVLELANVGLDLHETLSRFVELVSALPRKARTSWVGASRRVFDIGIQLRSRPSVGLGEHRGRAPFRAAARLERDQRVILRRCFAAGVTQVPRARHTTKGSASTSAALSDKSGRAPLTFPAPKPIPRLVLPTPVIS